MPNEVRKAWGGKARFLKDYGNGTYLFLISDYGHFYI